MKTGEREAWALFSGFLWVCFLLGVVFSSGCCAVPRAFWDGEQAVYNALAQEYVSYVEGDTSLSEDQAEDRKRTIRAWRYSLDQAERVAK